jgi:hypothetical protein
LGHFEVLSRIIVGAGSGINGKLSRKPRDFWPEQWS